MNHYISVQYSAIQKTVLRHNRLWSMAGISQGLSHLNEIVMPEIAKKCGGEPMVAGGGKFTASFQERTQAEKARDKIVFELTTRFPMLEFQVSKIISAKRFQSEEELTETESSAKGQGIIDQLNEEKRCFRGYGTSYLPHLAVCEECGEYPAELDFRIYLKQDKKHLCRTCFEAKNAAAITFNSLNGSESPQQTTLEKIYAKYLEKVAPACSCKPLADFSDLFPQKKDDGKENGGKESNGRMAVWLSDLNNMNQKVPIWLAQKETDILNTFSTVKQVNIEVIARALAQTFTDEIVKNREHLPFRLVVAGGDDLCLVTAEEYILTFAEKMDQAVRKKVEELEKEGESPLNLAWLQEKAKEKPKRDGKEREIGPYSFGAAFVITSIHTPFQRIHELGEELMKQAKEETKRLGNSVNWRVMAEGESVSDSLLEFERPIFLSREENALAKAAKDQNGQIKLPDFERLSFSDYLDLRKACQKLSSSHRFALISKLIELRAGQQEAAFETWLKCYDSGDRDIKSFSNLLTDNRLREGEQVSGALVPARIASLFELLGIRERTKEDGKGIMEEQQ